MVDRQSQEALVWKGTAKLAYFTLKFAKTFTAGVLGASLFIFALAGVPLGLFNHDVSNVETPEPHSYVLSPKQSLQLMWLSGGLSIPLALAHHHDTRIRSCFLGFALLHGILRACWIQNYGFVLIWLGVVGEGAWTLSIILRHQLEPHVATRLFRVFNIVFWTSLLAAVLGALLSFLVVLGAIADVDNLPEYVNRSHVRHEWTWGIVSVLSFKLVLDCGTDGRRPFFCMVDTLECAKVILSASFTKI
jgi:hypothetical protein